MAELVRKHAGKLIDALGLREQPLEHVDLAARQRDRVGDLVGDHRGIRGGIDFACLAQRVDQLRERGLAVRALA